MAGEVITVRTAQRPPQYWDASVFVDRSMLHPGSQPMSGPSKVVALLRERWRNAGRLVVFLSEYCGPGRDAAAIAAADWDDHAFEIADVAMFWWPDDEDQRLMPGCLAAHGDGRRLVCGAPNNRHLLRYADSYGISVAATLSEMASVALGKIGTGARRSGGEREVPLAVWRTESFRRWYTAQTSAGNRLDSARLVWTFGAGPRKEPLIYWALHVRVFIASENRVKSNEVVISRPDIYVMALYQRGATLDDSSIVLVREFRSSAATPDGFVHELPGGSGNTGADARDQAVRETAEETGLAIDARRVRRHGSRQLVATMSAHHAHLFTAEITSDELAQLRAIQSAPRGADATERTWTEVATFAEIRENRLVDWATLGMIAEALLADRDRLGSKHPDQQDVRSQRVRFTAPRQQHPRLTES